MAGTMTLWRPTGPQELEHVRASDWTAWPPRLPDQPIFYAVLNEQYAITIARDWNVPASATATTNLLEQTGGMCSTPTIPNSGPPDSRRPAEHLSSHQQ